MFTDEYEKLASKVKNIVDSGKKKELAELCGVTVMYIEQISRKQRLRSSAQKLQKIHDKVNKLLSSE